MNPFKQWNDELTAAMTQHVKAALVRANLQAGHLLPLPLQTPVLLLLNEGGGARAS